MARVVGVIGLGAMGSGIARNLLSAGLLAGVWNRSPAKAAPFAEEAGVLVAATPAELAAACRMLVLSVSADADVLELIDRLLPELAPGTLVIDTSTTRPQTAVDAAARLATVGARFVDAPVSGGVEGARRGSLVVMVGGTAEDFERAAPVFAAIGKQAERMGEVGAGQATKAVNQVMAAGINQAVSEALALAEAQHLPMAKLIDLVSGGAAGNWFLTQRGPTMVNGRFSPGFRVALHLKDLAIAARIVADLGAELPLVERTRGDYQRLVDQGKGDLDISSLFALKQALFTQPSGEGD